MQTIFVKHLVDDATMTRWRKFFSQEEIKHMLREFGREGVEDCIARLYEDNNVLEFSPCRH